MKRVMVASGANRNHVLGIVSFVNVPFINVVVFGDPSRAPWICALSPRFLEQFLLDLRGNGRAVQGPLFRHREDRLASGDSLTNLAVHQSTPVAAKLAEIMQKPLKLGGVLNRLQFQGFLKEKPCFSSRDDRIRTCDLLHPKQAR